MEKATKVFFVQKIAEGQFETESLWCSKKDEYFVVDNIPFIIKRISLGDTISAEFDEDDNQYYFENFISTSGNTTVRIFIYDDNYIQETRDWLNKNNCESEVLTKRNIIAVNIPKGVVYNFIREFLEKGEKEKKWTYEESCLEHEY
jgi:hypothetical protein